MKSSKVKNSAPLPSESQPAKVSTNKKAKVGFSPRSKITSAVKGEKVKEAKKQQPSSKKPVKPEALPPIKEEHKGEIDALCSEIIEINEGSWLTKGPKLINIATGGSELRPRFFKVKREVHFLACMKAISDDPKKWELIIGFYDLCIQLPFCSPMYPLREHLVARFTEYRRRWDMTEGQMVTFCREVNIDIALGVHHLSKADEESMKKVIDMLIEAKQKSKAKTEQKK